MNRRSRSIILSILCIFTALVFSSAGAAAQQQAPDVRVTGRPTNLFCGDTQTYKLLSGPGKQDYLNYYEAIRKKIKENLSQSYRYYYRAGDVILFFVLKSDGSLLASDIDHANSTDDAKLIDIAKLSLKKSAPFPPFPEKLSVPEMPFVVTISFKER